MTRMQFMAGLFVMGVMSLAGSFLAVYVLQSDNPLQAQEEDNKVVTSELQLKDDNGKLRALMTIDKNGDVLFTMLDANEQVRITQTVGNDGSGAVIINDQKGSPRISLLSEENEPGSVMLFDSDGEPAAMLGVAGGDFSMLTLRSPTGEVILGNKKDGESLFTMSSLEKTADGAEMKSFFNVVGIPGKHASVMLNNTRGGGSYQLMADDAGIIQESIKSGDDLLYFIRCGKDEGTSFQLDNPGGSRVYLQAQKGGRSLLQLNAGEDYLRAMSNSDGTGEFAIIKKKTFAWKETGK